MLQEMSILFAEIRTASQGQNNSDLEDTSEWMRTNLSWTEPIILADHGFIDKYTGETIIALFESADQALNAGISIYNSLGDYNQQRLENNYSPIDLGIGIHTGVFYPEISKIPNIKEGKMADDDLNLVRQIEKLTQSYGVSLFISHHALLKLDDITYYNLRFIDRVKVDHQPEMVTVYEVFDTDALEICQLKALTKTEFEQALVLYNMERFHQAALLFEDCLGTNPQDQAAQIYLQRCRQSTTSLIG